MASSAGAEPRDEIGRKEGASLGTVTSIAASISRAQRSAARMPAKGPAKSGMGSARTGSQSREVGGIVIGIDHQAIDLGAEPVDRMRDQRLVAESGQALVMAHAPAAPAGEDAAGNHSS